MTFKHVFRTGAGFLLLFPILGTVSAQDAAVGHWKTYWAASSILQMVQRDVDVFGVMEDGLAYVDTRDDILYGFDRNDGLSNVGVSALEYEPLYDALIVGYSDGMLDLVFGQDVVALSYIRDADMDGSKAINQVASGGRYAYLATGFGIVVVDLRKEEIKETYFVGDNNSRQNVASICTDGEYIFAIVDSRLKYAAADAPNLNDYAVWKTDSLLEGVSLRRCAIWNGLLAVGSGNQVFIGKPGQSWRELPLSGATALTVLRGFGDELLAGYYDSMSGWRADVYAQDQSLAYTTKGKNARAIGAALLDGQGHVWLGLETGEMLRIDRRTGETVSFLKEGPASSRCFDLSKTGPSLTVSGGGYSNSFAPSAIPFEVSVYDDGEWTVYDQESLQAAGVPSSVRSVVQTVEDPLQPGHFFAATSAYGLLEILPDGKMNLYTPENSTLQYNNVDHASCRVYGLDFDADGNLWILNNLSDMALHCRKRDGSWQAYDLGVSGLRPERVSDLLVDYWQHQWVLFDNSNVAVYETDGSYIQGLQVNMNNGNDLQTSQVFCIIEDDLGHIWMGTERGVKVIDQHARMFDDPVGNFTSVPVNTVRVPRDGYLINLLEDNQIMAIAVDGGNRKWLGTNSDGLYLVSSDGIEEIEHFTMANSPLPSNSITDLAIDDETGELFVATDRGLVSYRGTATRTEGNPEDVVRAFPNPVRPGYQGLINIKGLPQNAIVKITDTRGTLIYQGQATGGQLSWDGYGMQGRRPDSGILFVFASTEEGEQRLACKIFYIR